MSELTDSLEALLEIQHTLRQQVVRLAELGATQEELDQVKRAIANLKGVINEFENK